MGEVLAPHRVSPITIEPSKSRLFLNLIYLNCFMKDTPFSLDILADVPHLVKQGSYMTKLENSSGYHHLLMTESSRTLLDFQWGGHYFISNSLVFGWIKMQHMFIIQLI